MVTRTWIASLAPLLIVLPNLSHAAEYVAIPEEVLVLAGERGRGPGRDALGTDPVRAAIAAGKWTPPRAGDKVGEPGRERTWTTAKLKQGTPDSPGAASGYTYIPVPSDDSRVALLEARGHGMVYVNGEPRIGDVYGTGYVRLPVFLNKGTNHFLFAPGRGPVNVKFTKPKAEAEIHLGDVTAPELVAGEPTNALVGVPILNNTATPANDLILETTLAEGKRLIMKLPSLPPLSMRKVAVEIAGPATEKLGPITCSLVLRRGEQTLDKTSMTFNVVAPTSTRKVTFRSGIDGSVQYYGWVPATPDSDKNRSPGLILTLHGAGVEGIGQAACFSPKAGLHVVAPTNRRAFGFDWEDWGRQDAIEVLDLATKKLKTDLMRTYLTGHSMGGHGTWHLGVTYPDRFAAIGPSAGWVSLRSYGGLRRDDKPSAEREL
ncbi:MAG: alpha/beta hydrolase-fold protein, partial [Gemmataceae bacterium]